MDVATLHSIHTVLMFIAFIGIFLWAYSSKRKADFDEAANLPFADEPESLDDAKGEKS
ncbi:MAG: cbb3-type cytochrome c oxidase subunit 3 [Methylococcales bacterium]|jgi:cytochrome c oxidase cbb3-type subunit 4|nr:cbb3-type cytochrome c oxidase subunit 3 [Methylococcales bacterium]MBT7443551.1 cbb3-type cytochrome c oxidase subunit 3 [Methylococcales bacterium]